MMNSRRSFMWKMGAGASAALASAVVSAKPGASQTDDPALRAALLEEEKALRQLHAAYEQAMDKGQHEEALLMFAGDAEVVFGGATFARRDRGLERLYLELFRSGKSGRRMEPAPGFEVDAARQQDAVQVAADRLTATAAFPYSIQVGMPLESDSSLASMARLHGEGVRTWWEGGTYDVTYVKDAADGRWRITRLEYRTLSRADYRAGRSYATAMPASPLSLQHLDPAAGSTAAT